MLQSKLFTKTSKQAPKDETSVNASLLIRAGFVNKEMAGVYSYLPLGLRVLEKIKDIVREELNNIGCQELQMTALQQKDIWEKTNRWSDEVVDNWFKTKLKNETELGLAFTHEEPIANIAKFFVSSYKDLPFYAYQFQTKFRNELRAKSGILRGREFLMKDLYSFSTSKEQHNKFYEKMKEVYLKIFNRIGIGENTYLTMSSGEPFSKYSFEFQTLTPAGEDTVMYDKKKRLAINKQDYNEEIFKDFGLKKEDFNFEESKAIEIGDIYSLGYKYSEGADLNFTNENGKKELVYMGSYGIGINRVMGTVVEVHHDDKGMIWPEEIAPFDIHLLSLGEDEEILKETEKIYKKLQSEGVEVLWDDRTITAGNKFADSDLIGIPKRIVVSKKTLEADSVEVKMRNEEDNELVEIKSLF